MSFAAWTMFGLFFLWSFLGMPIGHAMLASAIVYLLLSGQDIALVATQSLNGLYGSFVLLAVPLFILAAEIMNAAQLTERHVRASPTCWSAASRAGWRRSTSSPASSSPA